MSSVHTQTQNVFVEAAWRMNFKGAMKRPSKEIGGVTMCKHTIYTVYKNGPLCLAWCVNCGSINKYEVKGTYSDLAPNILAMGTWLNPSNYRREHEACGLDPWCCYTTAREQGE